MTRVTPRDAFSLRRIGVVRSSLRELKDAPMQGYEGAQEAVVEIDEAFLGALEGLAPGGEVMLLTWLHLADRETMRVHPRDDPSRPLRGVFATRSPDRPNPIGLHPVRVLAVEAGGRLRVAPLEAVDGTPVVDIKPVLRSDRRDVEPRGSAPTTW